MFGVLVKGNAARAPAQRCRAAFWARCGLSAAGAIVITPKGEAIVEGDSSHPPSNRLGQLHAIRKAPGSTQPLETLRRCFRRSRRNPPGNPDAARPAAATRCQSGAFPVAFLSRLLVLAHRRDRKISFPSAVFRRQCSHSLPASPFPVFIWHISGRSIPLQRPMQSFCAVSCTGDEKGKAWPDKLLSPRAACRATSGRQETQGAE